MFIIQLAPKLGTKKRERFLSIEACPPWNTEIIITNNGKIHG